LLILTRKIDQSIIIQGNITVMVLGVERDRVKLGIAAPEEVTVLREELVDDDRGLPAPSPMRRPARATADVRGNLALKPNPKRT
jgi:carbon storage regulator CsrA